MRRFIPIEGLAVLAGLALALAVPGCSGDRDPAGGSPQASAGADSAAYAQAIAVEDTTARMTALRTVIRAHPRSDWAGRAYTVLVHLTREKSPGDLRGLLSEFRETDFASADPYNAVGWELADSGEHLDLAVPILEKAVAKARAAGDSLNLASCLDSEAWARFKAGDHAAAASLMEEAYAIYGPGNDEIDEHMALIYDEAGRDEEAAKIYVGLLSHMEHPEFRERLGAIVTASGGSLAETEAEIQRRRLEGARPAPDFTLPALADGKPTSLSDFRGKVVLLNFWHPT